MKTIKKIEHKFRILNHRYGRKGEFVVATTAYVLLRNLFDLDFLYLGYLVFRSTYWSKMKF